MSQQAAAGRGAGRGGSGRGPRYYPRKGGVDHTSKAYKSAISEIAEHTFNTGHNKYAAQFTRSREEIANYVQRTSTDEGYLVAETIRTGNEQTIPLPPPVDYKADLEIIRSEDIKTIAKRRQRLNEALKRGYATLYGQCSQEVRDKLKSTVNWEATQKEQSLHELIGKIERICVGFDDHKQEVFNLVQSLKTLFLYTQGERDTVEEYGHNFRSLWDTVEAFGGLPGIHAGLMDEILANKVASGQVATSAQVKEAGEESSKTVKAALLISGADRRRYGVLKDALANNYLLGSDQYPDTLEKAQRILSNYQTTRVTTPFKPSPNDTGVAFLQRGGRGGGRGGRGGPGGDKAGGTSVSTGDDVSTMTGRSGDGAPRTNSKGESHCFNCGAMTHWAYECPQPSGEQQAQLHMSLESQENGQTGEQTKEQGHQLLHISMTQGGELPEDRAYLDGCSTVTAFKNDKFLKEIRTVSGGIKINCNAGAVVMNMKGKFGRLNAWYLPDGIANIFSMHELEKLYRITYDSWEGFYVVHTPRGEVHFHKDEHGLPFIDLAESGREAARMLMQLSKDSHEGEEDEGKGADALSFVQTVRGNYEGYTR
jgi:hypothetical protein